MRRLCFSGLIWMSLAAIALARPGNRWANTSEAHPHTVIANGDARAKSLGERYANKRNGKKRLNWFCLSSSFGFIRPEMEKRPAGKNRPAIKEAITTLQKSLEEDETNFVALQNVVEQACNHYLHSDRFPTTYEELQPVPLLKVGMLTYAGDDGREKGQAYRLSLDLEAGVARFRFR